MIITVVRKPFKGALVDNIQESQCGGLNVDSCRIKSEDLYLPKYTVGRKAGWRAEEDYVGGSEARYPTVWTPNFDGRFPSNLLLSEEATFTIDQQSGISTTTSHYSYKRKGGEFIDGIPSQENKSHWKSETGGASRFFKVVKE